MDKQKIKQINMTGKVEYDHKADTLYIKLKEAKITDTRILSEDFYVDKDNNFVSVEIWQASKNAIQPLSQTLTQEAKTTIKKIVTPFC